METGVNIMHRTTYCKNYQTINPLFLLFRLWNFR